MILTQPERETPLWHKITQFLNERIAAAHIKLEGNMGPDATATLRGQIKEDRALLAIGQPRIEFVKHRPVAGHVEIM